jgi:hypothetical protein
MDQRIDSEQVNKPDIHLSVSIRTVTGCRPRRGRNGIVSSLVICTTENQNRNRAG